MTNFKPGDRVRLSPSANPARREALGGDAQGTITKMHTWGPTVHWDIPRPDWDGPEWREIELVTDAPAAYIAAATATLREKAALLRNERVEKEAEADRLIEEGVELGTRALELERAAQTLENIK